MSPRNPPHDALTRAVNRAIEQGSPVFEEQKPGFVVEGVDEDGSRTELASFDNSGEARAFLNRYVSRENAGNWDLIEVYDVRCEEESERLWFWEREND